MNYRVEVVPGEPIILATLFEQYSFAADDADANAEVIAIFDQSEEPMFLAIDTTHRAFSLDDVVHAANNDARGEDPLYHHPKMRELLIITHSDLIRLATKGLNTVTFGNVNAQAFKTVDEALAYARSQVSTQ
jgi:hypothetical protein